MNVNATHSPTTALLSINFKNNLILLTASGGILYLRDEFGNKTSIRIFDSNSIHGIRSSKFKLESIIEEFHIIGVYGHKRVVIINLNELWMNNLNLSYTSSSFGVSASSRTLIELNDSKCLRFDTLDDLVLDVMFYNHDNNKVLKSNKIKFVIGYSHNFIDVYDIYVNNNDHNVSSINDHRNDGDENKKSEKCLTSVLIKRQAYPIYCVLFSMSILSLPSSMYFCNHSNVNKNTINNNNYDIQKNTYNANDNDSYSHFLIASGSAFGDIFIWTLNIKEITLSKSDNLHEIHVKPLSILRGHEGVVTSINTSIFDDDDYYYYSNTNNSNPEIIISNNNSSYTQNQGSVNITSTSDDRSVRVWIIQYVDIYADFISSSCSFLTSFATTRNIGVTNSTTTKTAHDDDDNNYCKNNSNNNNHTEMVNIISSGTTTKHMRHIFENEKEKVFEEKEKYCCLGVLWGHTARTWDSCCIGLITINLKGEKSEYRSDANHEINERKFFLLVSTGEDNLIKLWALPLISSSLSNNIGITCDINNHNHSDDDDKALLLMEFNGHSGRSCWKVTMAAKHKFGQNIHINLFSGGNDGGVKQWYATHEILLQRLLKSLINNSPFSTTTKPAIAKNEFQGINNIDCVDHDPHKFLNGCLYFTTKKSYSNNHINGKLVIISSHHLNFNILNICNTSVSSNNQTSTAITITLIALNNGSVFLSTSRPNLDIASGTKDKMNDNCSVKIEANVENARNIPTGTECWMEVDNDWYNYADTISQSNTKHPPCSSVDLKLSLLSSSLHTVSSTNLRHSIINSNEDVVDATRLLIVICRGCSNGDLVLSQCIFPLTLLFKIQKGQNASDTIMHDSCSIGNGNDFIHVFLSKVHKNRVVRCWIVNDEETREGRKGISYKSEMSYTTIWSSSFGGVVACNKIHFNSNIHTNNVFNIINNPIVKRDVICIVPSVNICKPIDKHEGYLDNNSNNKNQMKIGGSKSHILAMVTAVKSYSQKVSITGTFMLNRSSSTFNTDLICVGNAKGVIGVYCSFPRYSSSTPFTFDDDVTIDTYDNYNNDGNGNDITSNSNIIKCSILLPDAHGCSAVASMKIVKLCTNSNNDSNNNRSCEYILVTGGQDGFVNCYKLKSNITADTAINMTCKCQLFFKSTVSPIRCIDSLFLKSSLLDRSQVSLSFKHNNEEFLASPHVCLGRQYFSAAEVWNDLVVAGYYFNSFICVDISCAGSRIVFDHDDAGGWRRPHHVQLYRSSIRNNDSNHDSINGYLSCSLLHVAPLGSNAISDYNYFKNHSRSRRREINSIHLLHYSTNFSPIISLLSPITVNVSTYDDALSHTSTVISSIGGRTLYCGAIISNNKSNENDNSLLIVAAGEEGILYIMMVKRKYQTVKGISVELMLKTNDHSKDLTRSTAELMPYFYLHLPQSYPVRTMSITSSDVTCSNTISKGNKVLLLGGGRLTFSMFLLFHDHNESIDLISIMNASIQDYPTVDTFDRNGVAFSSTSTNYFFCKKGKIRVEKSTDKMMTLSQEHRIIACHISNIDQASNHDDRSGNCNCASSFYSVKLGDTRGYLTIGLIRILYDKDGFSINITNKSSNESGHNCKSSHENDYIENKIFTSFHVSDHPILSLAVASIGDDDEVQKGIASEILCIGDTTGHINIICVKYNYNSSLNFSVHHLRRLHLHSSGINAIDMKLLPSNISNDSTNNTNDHDNNDFSLLNEKLNERMGSYDLFILSGGDDQRISFMATHIFTLHPSFLFISTTTQDEINSNYFTISTTFQIYYQKNLCSAAIMSVSILELFRKYHEINTTMSNYHFMCLFTVASSDQRVTLWSHSFPNSDINPSNIILNGSNEEKKNISRQEINFGYQCGIISDLTDVKHLSYYSSGSSTHNNNNCLRNCSNIVIVGEGIQLLSMECK